MTAQMDSLDRWHIFDSIFKIQRPFTVVDIFKPHGLKGFIETAQLFPHIAARHEESPGGLLHGTGLREVALQIAVAAIDPIRRPQPVDAEQLKCQRGRSGKAANREPGLCPAFKIHKFPRGKTKLFSGFDEGVNPGKQIRVWIQQEQEIGIGSSDALIDGRGESTIFAIRDQVDVCPLAYLVESSIARSVIDNDRCHLRSHLNE